jgi:hypothetical protein
MPGVVSALSVQPTGEPSQRDQTEIIFFGTVDSTVPPGQFPNVTNTSWAISAAFTGAPASSQSLWTGQVSLPITFNPQQTPKLVSAGLAESPYIADAQYASTEQRQRALWLEFDAPPADPNDEYFYRVLAYGPDPLLVSYPSDLPAQTEPALPIDPEWMRMIAAGDTNDDAGVGAMAQMLGATSPLTGGQPLHYMVPLPDSVTPASLEMFGFWTVEIRLGHTLWSTAQARYGRPLRISGVQFAPPPLVVNVERIAPPATPVIVAVANLAQTVYNGISLTNSNHPQTQIWFLLYAQVQRVDGQAWRNILLDKVLGTPIQQPAGTVVVATSSRQMPVQGQFLQSNVETALSNWHLPANTPTSVLAVELFNREANVIPPPSAPKITARATTFNQDDPLGAQLGERRILRVSPLTAVRAIC